MAEPSDTGAEDPCLNCEAPLTGPYCASCGQRSLPSKLGIGELLREIVGEALELDGRVLRTLVPFLFRPGFLSREYAAGRRARYSSPFRLFLFTTLLWIAAGFLARARTPGEGSEVNEAMAIDLDSETEGEIDPAKLAQAEHEAVDKLTLPSFFDQQARAFVALPGEAQADKILSSARESLPTAVLLTIPLFAAAMKLLFIRREHYYVEHLVFALHLHAFAFFAIAVGLLITPAAYLLPSALAVAIYALIALRNAYNTRWWTSALRLGLLCCGHALVLTITAAMLTGLGVLM